MKFDEERSEPVIKFLSELQLLCEKHKLSISHEDSQGAFIIENYDSIYMEWMLDAMDNTEE